MHALTLFPLSVLRSPQLSGFGNLHVNAVVATMAELAHLPQ